jgi:serine/threonine protein phosphatase PrpC
MAKKDKAQVQDDGDDGAARKKAAQEEHKRKREEAEAKKKALLEEKLAMSQHGLGVEELKGNRGTQEDRVTALRLPSGERLACVFDGHRGDSCSQFAMTRMPHSVSMLLSGGNDADEALRRAIGELHITWQESGADKSGATSSVAIVHGGSLFLATVGNSDVVLCSSKVADQLSKGVKPEDLHSGLLGNEDQDPKLQKPQVLQRKLTASDEFLILATDGVWTAIKPQKACDVVSKSLAEQPNACHLAAKALVDAAYNAESTDNIAAAVVLLHGYDATSGPPLPALEPPKAAEPAPSATPKPTATATAKPAAATATATAKPAAATATATAKPAAATATATAKPAAATATATAKPAAATAAEVPTGASSSASSSGAGTGGAGAGGGGGAGAISRDAISRASCFVRSASEAPVFARLPAGVRPGDEVRLLVSNRGASDGEYLVAVPTGYEPGMLLRVGVPYGGSASMGSGAADGGETHLLNVPPNARPGDTLSVKASWGALYFVQVPPGHNPGDTFAAEIIPEH